MTRQHLWTNKISQNKLRFTGHILRLPEGTPARQAILIQYIHTSNTLDKKRQFLIEQTNSTNCVYSVTTENIYDGQ